MKREVARSDGRRIVYEVKTSARQATNTLMFLHGMGGSRRQSFGYLGDLPHSTSIGVDMLGHGESSDLQASDSVSFDGLTDDAIAVSDDLGVEKMVVGGISMGAGIAVNAAIRYPARVGALILCRPAWLDKPQDFTNIEVYARIADLLETHDAETAEGLLKSEQSYGVVRSLSNSASRSLIHQVARPRAAANSSVLRRLPKMSPAPDFDSWTEISVPTLIIGHSDDPLHPWEVAKEANRWIPNSTLVRVPSKDEDVDAFANGVTSAIHTFLSSLAIEGNEA